jgi:N-carbamoyl-L-amino-acid hydrolase
MSRSSIVISPEQIEAHYAVLNSVGNLGHGCGFSRPAWSDAETAAMRLIEAAAEKGGLATRWDAVGNLIVETPGEFGEWIETGSHMDTVPGGGNYDGTAGVVAGLEALLALRGAELKRGLRLRVWRGEESASFGIASLGSRAAFGQLTPEVLERCYQGRTLTEAMQAQDAYPERIRSGIPTIDQAERDGIAAYVELHIEQGNVLESEEQEIGIVTGIRGSIRNRVTLTGAFDHSGATPLGRPYRRDVNLAMAYMHVRLDTLAEQTVAAGRDLVQTVGVINSDADINAAEPRVHCNAVAKVSGFGYFTHEVRSTDAETARAFMNGAATIIHDTAREFGVQAMIEEFSCLDGVPALDEELQSLLLEACHATGASVRHLPSGAWHDAAVLCAESHSDGVPIPVGMLFIPCRGGISHSPEEKSTPEQIARGASVLAGAMQRLAGSAD